VPPLFALLDSSYQVANYMTELRWAPLNAATVISAPKWNRIPEKYRPKLLEIAQSVARELRSINRQSGEDAIREMKSRGLSVVTLTPQELALWRAEAEQGYPKLRGSYVDADLFDEVMRLHEEYRSKQSSRPSQ